MDKVIELAKQAGFKVKNFKPPVVTAQHSNGSWVSVGDELHAFYTIARADLEAENAKLRDAAAQARVKALEEAKELCEYRMAPDGLSISEKSIYDTATLDCADAIEKLKGGE